MSKKPTNAISPTRSENYPEWFQQAVKAGALAESSPVRGCMVIKPWGYALWERMQRILDDKFKETGHVNAYFPLFIPLRYLEKEAEHVEGFAKECAVVTHHRLEPDGKGGLKPAGPLDEPLVVRPTSETIIGEMYAKWVQSYRDLPLLINQWANVVRWEMRTRLFLRTAEFLWQEGHTVHATKEEAMEETLKMLDVYANFAEESLAMPVIKGEKTPDERFPGAVSTYTIEAMMQDGKALQSGTSHFLGQNFANASGIQFLDKDGVKKTAWTTSWGVSTRMIGGVVMTHGDDDGLRLPPAVAPHQVVINPIYKDATRDKVMGFVGELAASLRAKTWRDEKIRVHIDDRDIRGGEKGWDQIKRGVPIRLDIGPKDIEKNSVFVGRRDKQPKDKSGMERAVFENQCADILSEIQDTYLREAKKKRDSRIVKVSSKEELVQYFTDTEDPGWVQTYWDLESSLDAEFKKHKISPRCLPLDHKEASGTCIASGGTGRAVLIGRSY